MRISLAATLLTLFLLTTYARAALTLGDPAPNLTLSKWVKGDPVKSFEKDKLYVVEFWATWCGPCKTSIPHLTEMAHKYKDVTFIGTSVWENDDAAVVPFVKDMGDKMDYHIAMDDKSKDKKGAMAINWMDAAAQDGIPTAFLIGKDSKILWIGHPMELEPILEKVTAGTYDFSAAKTAFEKQQLENIAARKLQEEYQTKVMSFVATKDFPAALKALDEMIAAHPESAGQLNYSKFNIALQAKQLDTAYAAADEASRLSPDNAGIHNELAWSIATTPNLEKRDLDRALKFATRACDLTKNENANLLDTLARVYFVKGDSAKAIEFEQKAIAKSTSAEEKASLTKTLAEYQAKPK